MGRDPVGVKQREIVRLCREESVPPSSIARMLGVTRGYVLNVLSAEGVSVRERCPETRGRGCLQRLRALLGSSDSPGFIEKGVAMEAVSGCRSTLRSMGNKRLEERGFGVVSVYVPRPTGYIFLGERGRASLLDYLATVFADYMAEKVLPRWRKPPTPVKLLNYIRPRVRDAPQGFVRDLASHVADRLKAMGYEVYPCNGPCIDEIIAVKGRTRRIIV